jgi:hypothetical protein
MRAFPDFGKVQHGIDEASAAAWGDVAGLGLQRHPGGAAGYFRGDHFGRGDCAVIVADLEALTQIVLGHVVPPTADPARTRARARAVAALLWSGLRAIPPQGTSVAGWPFSGSERLPGLTENGIMNFALLFPVNVL